MRRRHFIQKTSRAGIGMAMFPYINTNAYRLFADNDTKYSDRAIRIVAEALVIDMLSPLGDDIHKREGMSVGQLWLSRPGRFTKQDYQWCRDSGINVFGLGWAGRDHEAVTEYLARWNGCIASNSQYLERIDSVSKLNSISASKKIGILLTLQNSNHFRELKDVDLFYQLGQRVSQLTYNERNRLGCGAFVDVDEGLTEFGAAVVGRMNTIGMGVDVSHCGDKTTLDAASISQKPVLITHAACRSLNPGYSRAKTDEAIKKVASTGGMIGIPMLRFMVRDREPVTIEHFLDHIDYAVKLVGLEKVGIGSDQGLVTEDHLPVEVRGKRLETAHPKYRCHTNEKFLIGIEDLNHSKRTFDVTEGLIRRKYSDEEIKMVLGKNFKRVLQKIFMD